MVTSEQKMIHFATKIVTKLTNKVLTAKFEYYFTLVVQYELL